jgi:signal transduction histidine kinase/ActR/RegA family two-component response regulator
MLLLFIVAISIFYAAVQYRTGDLVKQRLNARAFELAESFAIATEINNSRSNLIRIVNSVGAYDDVNVLYLIDDESGRIVAASRNRYVDSLVSELLETRLKALMGEAIATRNNGFLNELKQTHSFVYKLHTISQNKRSIRRMSLLMEIDTSGSEAYIHSITVYFFSSLLGLLTIVAGLAYIFIRNIILKPIYKLVNSIKRTKERRKPVISTYRASDQLGVLTKAYNEMILDSFKKQQELTKEREKSEAALLAKSQFLAMMTHELRTPLNGVIGMSGQLNELINEPEQQKYLEVIRLSANQLLNIINDTLDFSKIEADKLSLDIQPFDLVTTLRNVVTMFEPQIKQKDVELNFSTPIKPLPILAGDEVRLNQVIINLLGNAVKFTESGHIDVTIEVVSQTIEKVDFTICVSDSGIGLSEEQIASLFSEFTQADSSTTRKYGGTGLGLWISKKLMDKMSGEIVVTGELGVGAKFCVYLTLPISEGNILDETNFARQPQMIEDKQINVLLVEDTEINRMVVMAILDQKNIHFTVAENGLEAVNVFKDATFDLIFMDCLMPVMDGFEACHRIRQYEQINTLEPTPIIALTANALEETRQQCIEAGMDDFLTKPVVPELLHNAVYKWAGGKD